MVIIFNSFIPVNNYDFRASCSEMNDTCYPEFKKPIRARKNAIHCFNIYSGTPPYDHPVNTTTFFAAPNCISPLIFLIESLVNPTIPVAKGKKSCLFLLIVI